MANVAVILAQGFEEIEAISVIDVLRRGGVNVLALGLEGLEIKGANGISVMADGLFDKTDFGQIDMIILPGGSSNLAQNTRLKELLADFNAKGKKLGAICAAPMVLGRAGVISGAYTCYPGFESQVSQDAPSQDNVVINMNIITSRGPATSMEFALACLSELTSKQNADEIAKGLLFNK